jgi:hypothetical protein
MWIDYFAVLGGSLTNIAAGADALLYRDSLQSVPTARRRKSIYMGLTLTWVACVSYMTLVKFDFLLHIVISVLTGAVGTVLWIVWYYRNRKSVAHAWMIALGSVSLFPLLLAFEINDFPPGQEGLADAHSFWHLSTIPVSGLFGWFLFKESERDAVAGDEKKGL